MKKMTAAASPEAYVKSLRGWRRGHVEMLRDAVSTASALDEAVKWGHLVSSGKYEMATLVLTSADSIEPGREPWLEVPQSLAPPEAEQHAMLLRANEQHGAAGGATFVDHKQPK